MNPLDWLNALPPFWAALLAIGILDAPFGVSIIWLVVKVRRSVTKSSKLMDVAPDLDDHQKLALAWSLRQAIKTEEARYELARKRGEA